jgi:hypothetical protein
MLIPERRSATPSTPYEPDTGCRRLRALFSSFHVMFYRLSIEQAFKMFERLDDTIKLGVFSA